MTDPDYFGDYWRARLNRAELEHQQEQNRMRYQIDTCENQRLKAREDRAAAIERAESAERARDYWRIKYETLSNEIGATDNE